MFDAISKAEFIKFLCCELWTIVRNNLIWNSISGKQRSQNVDCPFCSCGGHCNNFRPLGASIDYDEPHLSFKKTSKIKMKPLPGLLWPFPWMKWGLSWISLILLTGLALFGTFLNVLINLRLPDMSPCQ